MPAFATTSACRELPFGRKIGVPDSKHGAKVQKRFFVLARCPSLSNKTGGSEFVMLSEAKHPDNIEILHFVQNDNRIEHVLVVEENAMRKKTLICLFIFLSFFCLAFAQTQQEYYSNKLNTYFSKDHKVKDFVSISKDGISIFSGESHKQEIFLSWQEVTMLAPVISTISERELKKLLIDKKDSLGYYINKDSVKERNIPHSLKDMKIAIDPGHIGGTYHSGEVESRCMTLAIDSTKQIKLVEGNLAFFTSLLLKQKLDSMGAHVMLTRSDTGLSSLGITFFEWKKKIKNKTYLDSLIENNLISEKGVELLKKHLPDKVLFSDVFGSVDMTARAKKINAFQPDITVIIHYNVNEKNIGWKRTTDKDYVMAFVPGCITAKDLETLAGRLNFLRLLISPDIENSVRLSSAIVNNISNKLNVPLAHSTDASYLTEHCLSTTETGVYSRDLALTRMIKGPLVYGEPLYQDNNQECILLTSENSERIKLVANAYYDGILEFLSGK